MSNPYYNSNFPPNFMGGNVPVNNSGGNMPYMNNAPPYNMYPVAPPAVMHPGQHMVQHVMVPVPVPVQNPAAFAAYGPQQIKTPKVDDLNYYLGNETVRHSDRRSRSRSRSADRYSDDWNRSKQARSRNDDYRSQSPEGSRHSTHRKSSHRQSDRDIDTGSRDRNPFKDRGLKHEESDDINSNPFRTSTTKSVPFRKTADIDNSNPFRNKAIEKTEDSESIDGNQFRDSSNRTEDREPYRERDRLQQDLRSRDRDKRDRNARSRNRNARSRDSDDRSRNRDEQSRERDNRYRDRRDRSRRSRDKDRRSRDYRDHDSRSRDQDTYYKDDEIEDSRSYRNVRSRERDVRSQDRRSEYQSTSHIDDLDNISRHSDAYEHKESRNRQYEKDLRHRWNESKRAIEERSDHDDYDQDLYSDNKRRKYSDEVYDKGDNEGRSVQSSRVRETGYDRYNAYDTQTDAVSDLSDSENDLIVPDDNLDRWSDRQRETSPISDGEIEWPRRHSNEHRRSDEFGKHLKITIENDRAHLERHRDSRHKEDRISRSSRSSNRDRPKLFIDGEEVIESGTKLYTDRERVSERGTILFEDRDENISKRGARLYEDRENISDRGTVLYDDRKEKISERGARLYEDRKEKISERGTVLFEDRDDISDSRMYDRNRESVRDYRGDFRDDYDKRDGIYEGDSYRRDQEYRHERFNKIEKDNRNVDNYPNYARYPNESRRQRNDFDNTPEISSTGISDRREPYIKPRDLRSNIGPNVVRPPCSVNFKVPTLCLSYSTHEGCNDSKCTKWHVCKFFVKGVCNFGLDCKRGHNFFIGGIYKALCEANDQKVDFMKMNLKDVQYKIIGKLREQIRSYLHPELVVVEKVVKEVIDPEFDASNYDECGNFIGKPKDNVEGSTSEKDEKAKGASTDNKDDKKSDDNSNLKVNASETDSAKTENVEKKVDDKDKSSGDHGDNNSNAEVQNSDNKDNISESKDKTSEDIDKSQEKVDSADAKSSSDNNKDSGDKDKETDNKTEVKAENEKEDKPNQENLKEVESKKETSNTQPQKENIAVKEQKKEQLCVETKSEKSILEKETISPSLSPISVENIDNWDEYERYEKVSDDEVSNISDNELEETEELENVSSDEETDFSSSINPRNFLAKTAVPIGMNDPLVFNPSKAAPPGEEPTFQSLPPLPYIPIDRPPPTHLPPPVAQMPQGPLFPAASSMGGVRPPGMYPQPGYPPVVPDITKPPPQMQPVNYLPSPNILQEVIDSLQANKTNMVTPKVTVPKRKCDGDLEALAEKNPELNEVIQTPWQFPHKTVLNMSAIEFVTETEAYKEEFVAELMRILISIDLPYVTMKKLLALIKEKMLINISSHADMKKILSFYPECFLVIETVDSDDEDDDPDLVRRNIKIKAKLSLGFCDKHGYLPFATGKCDCNALHICRFYFLNVCNKKKCKFGHQLKTNHNMTVFRAHRLHRMTGKEVITYIRDIDNRHVDMWPEVCRYYNREKGECYKGDNIDPDVMCHKLHLCLFFAKGVCYKHHCRRSHKISDIQPTTLLQMHGIDPNIVGEEKIIQTLTDVVREMERKKTARNVPNPANKKVVSDKIQDSMIALPKPIDSGNTGESKLATDTKVEKKLPSVRDRVTGPVKTLNIKLPLVCKFYNNELGCKKRDWGPSGYCMFIHVCQHFVSGDCKFGEKCKRSHDLLSGQAATLLQKQGLGPGLYTSREIADMLNHPDELVEVIIPLNNQAATSKTPVTVSESDDNVLGTEVKTDSKAASKGPKTSYKSYSVEDMLEQIMKRGQEEQEMQQTSATGQDLPK